MKEVKLATVGSGPIVHTILDRVKQTEGIRLEAVYSRTEEKGRALAAAYGAEKVYTELDRMLADPEVNTVYLASPNLLHAEQTERALLAGKHVLCEKPFVTTLAQAKALAELAEARGCFLLEAVPTAYLPNLRVLREELQSIGRVRIVQGNYTQYSSRYDAVLRGEKPNIFHPDFAGGALMDINYYNVYLNVALFGAPERAVYFPNRYPGLADTSGVMVLQYEGFVSQNAGAKDCCGVSSFLIEGERGCISIENGSNGLQSVHIVTPEGERVRNEQPELDRWGYEMREVSRILRTEDAQAVRARMETTLQVVRVMERARLDAGLVFPGDEM